MLKKKRIGKEVGYSTNIEVVEVDHKMLPPEVSDCQKNWS